MEFPTPATCYVCQVELPTVYCLEEQYVKDDDDVLHRVCSTHAKVWAIYPEWDVCWGGDPPAPCEGLRDLDRETATELADRMSGAPLGLRFVARLLSSGGRPPTPPTKSKGADR